MSGVRAIRWGMALAACGVLGATPILASALDHVGGWGVMAGCFALGLLVGPRAIAGVVATVAGATVVTVAQIDPNAYTDFEGGPDVAILLGGGIALLLALAATAGAFLRWVVGRATSSRASD